MISKNRRLQCYTVTCDECGDFDVLGADEFVDAVDEIKDSEYAIRKVDGDWKHYCKTCK